MDLGLEGEAFGQEDIEVPADPNDPFFQDNCHVIHFTRTEFIEGFSSQREQVNSLTSFLGKKLS